MKKAAMIIAASLIAMFSPPLGAGNFVTYAYLPSDAVLEREDGSAVCTLPATYFAEICGDEKDGRYPVAYLDLSGYIKSSSLEITDYEPVTKFPSLTARPDNDGMPVNLRDLPDTVSGKVLYSVPADATLTLYGRREGGELFSGAGRVWQYVRYDTPAGNSVYGYVYSPQLRCDAVTPNKIEKVERKPAADDSEEIPSRVAMTPPAKIAVTAAMCVPAIIIILALFYRPSPERKPRQARHGSNR